ncbi:MAG: hypothetical protein HQL91_10045 [Magnetococcales bacterium]|nr:hypothetical protein [Magnetococcales bacterium]
MAEKSARKSAREPKGVACMPEKSDEKQLQGRFRPGKSGNPAGRPRGTGFSARLRAELEAHGVEVVESVLNAAKGGDMRAAKLVLERILPPLRPTAEPLRMSIPLDEGLASAGEAILQAVVGGQISLEAGRDLIGMVSQQATIAGRQSGESGGSETEALQRLGDIMQANLNANIEAGRAIAQGDWKS